MTERAPSITAVTGRLIELLDAHLPGRLVAFYLTGSIALGDYWEGRSDIDFIAVLAGAHDAAVLGAVHAGLAGQYPHVDCDGIYLRSGELSQPPGGVGIEGRGGRVNSHSAAERHPAAWLILADAGIALRGRAPDHRWIAADRAAAIDYSRRNLDSYWRPWLEIRRRLLSPALLRGDGVTWGCLGIARLHATIATGRVPSKSAAGEHALAAFPGHARILEESLRLRREPARASLYRSPLTRRRDAIAFMADVLASATRQPAPPADQNRSVRS